MNLRFTGGRGWGSEWHRDFSERWSLAGRKPHTRPWGRAIFVGVSGV